MLVNDYVLHSNFNLLEGIPTEAMHRRDTEMQATFDIRLAKVFLDDSYVDK